MKKKEKKRKKKVNIVSHLKFIISMKVHLQKEIFSFILYFF